MNRFSLLTEVLTSAIVRYLNETHDRLPNEEEEDLADLIVNQINANEGDDNSKNVNEDDLTNYYREVYLDFKNSKQEGDDDDENMMGDFEEFIRKHSFEDFVNMDIKFKKS